MAYEQSKLRNVTFSPQQLYQHFDYAWRILTGGAADLFMVPG
jgi:hypothetical protein